MAGLTVEDLGIQHNVNTRTEGLGEGHNKRCDALRRLAQWVDCRRDLQQRFFAAARVKPREARLPLLRNLLALDAFEALAQDYQRGLKCK